MVIGINASALSKRKGGASFYILNITKALAEIDKQNHYHVFTTVIGKEQFGNLPSNFTIHSVAPRSVVKRLIWEQTALPYLCKKYKVNTLFSPNYTSPLILPGIRSVVTIHDLSFFPLAKLYPIARRMFKPIIHLSVRFSSKVIAVSEYTRKDILRYIGPFDDKIKVIYEAADSRFTGPASQDEIDRVRDLYQIPGRYFLFTGFLEPRKNLERLLQAFASVQDKNDQYLVIAGGEGWWYEATYRKVKELGLEKRVIFTGYVSDDHLQALYSGATFFAFPSLYEGFGIAALESICCGTPVLASNNTALPEVVGNAGVFVDPFNIKEIGNAILSFTEQGMKIPEENCLAAGNKFSWNKAAIETLELLSPSTEILN